MKARLKDEVKLPSVARVPLSGRLLVACGLWMVLLGVYFVLLRPALLPEDPRFMSTSIEALRVAAPGMERWLGHVFNVMGGFMVAAGTMIMLVAWRFLANRAPGTLAALIVTGASGVALMSATNFMLDSDFRWLSLAPALLLLAGISSYVGSTAFELGILLEGLRNSGLTSRSVALMFAECSLVMLAVNGLLFRTSILNAQSARRLMSSGLLLAMIGLTVLAVQPNHGWMYVGVSLTAAGTGLVLPVISYLAAGVSRAELGVTMGGLAASASFGQTVGSASSG